MKVSRFDLARDFKGMIWDLLLYVPTVVILLSMAAKFWYQEEHEVAYLLLFLGSFFCIAGANRIFKTRLMLMPSSPIAIEIGKSVGLILRNGRREDFVKDMRYFSDYAGRSFGLAGTNGNGQRLQFVFHKGQFTSVQDYQAVQDNLKKLL
jgi:hypothetical protein